MASHHCMDHLRKLAILAVVVVQWTTLWRQVYDEKPRQFKHQRVFEDEKEARRFYDHRPAGLFECINSVTGNPGFCEVTNTTIILLEDKK